MPAKKSPAKNKIGHTPGPWRAHLNAPTAAIEGHLIKVDDDIACPVASLWVGGGTIGKPRQIANAHLIAAAPELLEALQLLEFDLGHISPKVFDEEISEKAKAKLKSALAKAQGINPSIQ